MTSLPDSDHLPRAHRCTSASDQKRVFWLTLMTGFGKSGRLVIVFVACLRVHPRICAMPEVSMRDVVMVLMAVMLLAVSGGCQ